jgi:hypothetical protein
MILSIPWLIIAVVLYNLIAFTMSWEAATPGGPVPLAGPFNYELFSISMISGARWALTLGDVVIVITLMLLFVELVKSTRTSSTSIVDHALSTILFILCMIEFLVVERAATSVFFIITVITLIDVVAGFSITIRAARRDLTMGGIH